MTDIRKLTIITLGPKTPDQLDRHTRLIYDSYVANGFEVELKAIGPTPRGTRPRGTRPEMLIIDDPVTDPDSDEQRARMRAFWDDIVLRFKAGTLSFPRSPAMLDDGRHADPLDEFLAKPSLDSSELARIAGRAIQPYQQAVIDQLTDPQPKTVSYPLPSTTILNMLAEMEQAQQAVYDTMGIKLIAHPAMPSATTAMLIDRATRDVKGLISGFDLADGEDFTSTWPPKTDKQRILMVEDELAWVGKAAAKAIEQSMRPEVGPVNRHKNQPGAQPWKKGKRK